MNIAMNDQTIKEILIKDDEHFKNLDLKHREFHQRIEEIDNRTFKTENDLVEVQNLKKHKLRLKDSMEKYILEYRRDKVHEKGINSFS